MAIKPSSPIKDHRPNFIHGHTQMTERVRAHDWSSTALGHRGALRFRSSQQEGRSGTVFTMFLPFDAVSR